MNYFWREGKPSLVLLFCRFSRRRPDVPSLFKTTHMKLLLPSWSKIFSPSPLKSDPTEMPPWSTLPEKKRTQSRYVPQTSKPPSDQPRCPPKRIVTSERLISHLATILDPYPPNFASKIAGKSLTNYGDIPLSPELSDDLIAGYGRRTTTVWLYSLPTTNLGGFWTSPPPWLSPSNPHSVGPN